ncbi:hypothetical protein HY570_01965 [Candidatus Micrarchaeota archaeon]|nr:hypothetical protein [Candidatus Micrarchaeota archaeon]
MGKKEEIEMVIEWCKKIKQERARVYIIEPNPFRDKYIDWLRNKIYIEIDRPTSIANKLSLVYDSTTNSLWEYTNGVWRRLDS